jgi:hypothetical protein
MKTTYRPRRPGRFQITPVSKEGNPQSQEPVGLVRIESIEKAIRSGMI